jgi:hypothetical protein
MVGEENRFPTRRRTNRENVLASDPLPSQRRPRRREKGTGKPVLILLEVRLKLILSIQRIG